MAYQNDTTETPKPALVFGASGEQGQAVLEGLSDYHDGQYFSPIYAFGRHVDNHETTTETSSIQYLQGDIQNPDHVGQALQSTRASCIFVVTTTNLPETTVNTNDSTVPTLSDHQPTEASYSEAAGAEYQVIQELMDLIVQAYKHDGIERHVIISTKDNVQRVVRAWNENTTNTNGSSSSTTSWIEPLEDGSIVPHYSAKGKGGEYAMDLIRHYQDEIEEQGLSKTFGVRLTLLTLPFLYSNFLGFFAPLPNNNNTMMNGTNGGTDSPSKTTTTTSQWILSACFGNGNNKIDMMGSVDLTTIVPNIFANPDKYNLQNLRIVGEQISMEEIAATFSDLFGKDVIYNPLLPEELAALPFAAAPAMAQMCQFLGDPRMLRHDLALTKELAYPRQPQKFQDWLLTHSDSPVFTRVGLDLDAPEIQSVVVFGACSLEGISVIKGLLADQRKRYTIRATTRHVDSEKAQTLRTLAPEDRLEIVYADFDDIASCRAAAEGVDGAFLVTDFYQEAGQDMQAEERHARNVIDACEASHTVKHLVFSTMESVEEMNQTLGLNLSPMQDAKGQRGTVVQFDAKARAAAYARTKKLSVTYVLMPCYSELFFERIEKRPGNDGEDRFVLTLPLKDDTKVMCMSVDELGPAVANIFDSYQVYAGHEIGLVTDFVTIKEVRDIIQEVFSTTNNGTNDNCDGTSNNIILETEELMLDEQETEHLQAGDTYMKDLGQMFAYMSHSDAVQMRHSIAKTLKLVPSALPLREWVEKNVDNEAFREKLGLR